MKESLLDIFERVWPSYWEFILNEPTDREQYLTSKRERIKAASEYASSLKALGDDWIEAVNNDVMSLAAPIHFPPSIIFSKDKRKTYRLCVQSFLTDVREAIITHGRTERQLTELLKPITCYLLNIVLSNMVVKESLSKDEAYSEYKQMRLHGFNSVFFPTELFPAQYVLIGYEPEQASTQAPEQASTQASTQAPTQTPEQAPTLEELIKDRKIPTIAKTDKEYLMFGEALRKQYMYLENDCYHWTLPKSLLAYMCGYIYCGDRIKKDEDDNETFIKGGPQFPAKEVTALFSGFDVHNSRYQIIRNYKLKKELPRGRWKINDLIQEFENEKKALIAKQQKSNTHPIN